ncbi:MAG: hypothetical protein MK538_13270 [Planctomycetes bacterium]|nr:hypothetical protein [Planctomycetota bacterium]
MTTALFGKRRTASPPNRETTAALVAGGQGKNRDDVEVSAHTTAWTLLTGAVLLLLSLALP